MTRHRTRYPDIHAAAGRPLTLPRDLKNFAANDDERDAAFRAGPLEARVMPTVHIYAPPVTERFIRAGNCPDCGKRTRFLGWCYEWHGPTQVCIRCGRTWQDGEWMPLPFMRGARAHNIAEAKARWRRG